MTFGKEAGVMLPRNGGDTALALPRAVAEFRHATLTMRAGSRMGPALLCAPTHSAVMGYGV
jgi:hypothetical protein